ncbi:MAG: hypothetical protein ABIP39_14955 [Polyangiaceae bacterium]
MRSTTAIILSCGLALAACSKTEDKPSTTTTTTSAVPAAVPAPVAPPVEATPAAVETSADMKAFMAMLDGGDASAGKALKKYGAKAMQGNDLGMYTLKNPKVTKAEKVGVMQCYTMESTAGVMKHTSRLCWDTAGKIAQITDKAE